MALELEEQYDKIYKYCYMKIHHRQVAEDITQETFLRFLENHNYKEIGKKLSYLYTIARNLCMDQFRKNEGLSLTEDIGDKGIENEIIQSLTLKQAVLHLELDEQELIFLRYVNEIPINHISVIMNISRYSVYRKTKECLKKLQKEIKKEEWF